MSVSGDAAQLIKNYHAIHQFLPRPTSGKGMYFETANAHTTPLVTKASALYGQDIRASGASSVAAAAAGGVAGAHHKASQLVRLSRLSTVLPAAHEHDPGGQLFNVSKSTAEFPALRTSTDLASLASAGGGDKSPNAKLKRLSAIPTATGASNPRRELVARAALGGPPIGRGVSPLGIPLPNALISEKDKFHADGTLKRQHVQKVYLERTSLLPPNNRTAIECPPLPMEAKQAAVADRVSLIPVYLPVQPLERATAPSAALVCRVEQPREQHVWLNKSLYERPLIGPVRVWPPKSVNIFFAAFEGNLGDVQLYIEEGGVDVNETDDVGHTALSAACQGGHVDVVEYLLLMGASWEDHNPDRWTPLHFAAHAGHHDICKFLILNAKRFGFDPYQPNAHGDTPLHLVAAEGHYETCCILLEAAHCVSNDRQLIRKLMNAENIDGKTMFDYAKLGDSPQHKQILYLRETFWPSYVRDMEARIALRRKNILDQTAGPASMRSLHEQQLELARIDEELELRKQLAAAEHKLLTEADTLSPEETRRLEAQCNHLLSEVRKHEEITAAEDALKARGGALNASGRGGAANCGASVRSGTSAVSSAALSVAALENDVLLKRGQVSAQIQMAALEKQMKANSDPYGGRDPATIEPGERALLETLHQRRVRFQEDLFQSYKGELEQNARLQAMQAKLADPNSSLSDKDRADLEDAISQGVRKMQTEQHTRKLMEDQNTLNERMQLRTHRLSVLEELAKKNDNQLSEAEAKELAECKAEIAKLNKQQDEIEVRVRRNTDAAGFDDMAKKYREYLAALALDIAPSTAAASTPTRGGSPARNRTPTRQSAALEAAKRDHALEMKRKVEIRIKHVEREAEILRHITRLEEQLELEKNPQRIRKIKETIENYQPELKLRARERTLENKLARLRSRGEEDSDEYARLLDKLKNVRARIAVMSNLPPCESLDDEVEVFVKRAVATERSAQDAAAHGIDYTGPLVDRGNKLYDYLGDGKLYKLSEMPQFLAVRQGVQNLRRCNLPVTFLQHPPRLLFGHEIRRPDPGFPRIKPVVLDEGVPRFHFKDVVCAEPENYVVRAVSPVRHLVIANGHIQHDPLTDVFGAGSSPPVRSSLESFTSPWSRSSSPYPKQPQHLQQHPTTSSSGRQSGRAPTTPNDAHIHTTATTRAPVASSSSSSSSSAAVVSPIRAADVVEAIGGKDEPPLRAPSPLLSRKHRRSPYPGNPLSRGPSPVPPAVAANYLQMSPEEFHAELRNTEAFVNAVMEHRTFRSNSPSSRLQSRSSTPTPAPAAETTHEGVDYIQRPESPSPKRRNQETHALRAGLPPLPPHAHSQHPPPHVDVRSPPPAARHYTNNASPTPTPQQPAYYSVQSPRARTPPPRAPRVPTSASAAPQPPSSSGDAAGGGNSSSNAAARPPRAISAGRTRPPPSPSSSVPTTAGAAVSVSGTRDRPSALPSTREHPVVARSPARSLSPLPAARSSSPAPARSSSPAPARSSSPVPARSSSPVPARSSSPMPRANARRGVGAVQSRGEEY